MGKIFATMFMYASFPLIIPQRSRRDIVLASSVRPSIPSVYTSVHQSTLLSVLNHISVPIRQI